MDHSPPSDRVRVRRIAERGDYDPATIRAILAEGLVAHVALSYEGAPVVLPMAYGFDEQFVYLHGSAGNRMLRHLAGGAAVCIEVTLLDGLVLARSLFHHSMNYRTVVVHGPGEAVEGDEKLAALRTITEHIVPGQWDVARAPSAQELRETGVVRVSLTEASAKVRGGPPIDDERDRALPIWGGILPVQRVFGAPLADELSRSDEPPSWLRDYHR